MTEIDPPLPSDGDSPPPSYEAPLMPQADDPPLSASEIFARYERQRADGMDVDFQSILDAYPDKAQELESFRRDALGWQGVAQAAGLAKGHDDRPYDPVLAARTFAECVGEGKEFGGFRLEALLGKGGMGEVWRAEELRLQRQIALKVIRPDRMNKLTLALFEREARATASIRHPNLVPIYAYNSTGGVAWIAMEFVEGGRTLHDLRLEDDSKAPCSDAYARTVASTVAAIADALHAAHVKGVIHRDLKPENVLLDTDGRPRVTDFGLAKVQDGLDLSQSGVGAGTAPYMSPEQIDSRHGKIGPWSDVFGLGVILYELLAHRRPFDHKDSNHLSIWLSVLQDESPDIAQAREGVPRALALVIGKCLEKAPRKRYASMQDMAADLRRFLANRRVEAEPTRYFDRFDRIAVLADDTLRRTVRCHDRLLAREVLLEFPASGSFAFPTRDGTSREVREAQILARITHPSLPRVHDIIQSERGPVLVLEAAAGETLAERLARTGPLAPDEVRQLAIELGGALAAVHEVRAVHRALSARCVVLRADGTSMLRGFHFARFATHMQGASTYDELRRKAAKDPEFDRRLLPLHPAPEQFGNAPATAKSDLFALGWVLYEAATGRDPIEDYGPGLYVPIVPLATAAPEIDPVLAAEVDACLARMPLGRPDSATAFVEAIAQQPRAPFWRRLRDWRPRRRSSPRRPS